MTFFYKKDTAEPRNNEIITENLGDILQKSENYLYLVWAWCSKNSGWKLMSDLWTEYSPDPDFSKYQTITWYTTGDNLEDFLSRLKNTETYFENTWNTESTWIKEFREKIESKIVQHCRDDIKLGVSSEHRYFLDKITNRKLSQQRTKVFTLNYDALFEQAGNEMGYVVIDGFSFTSPRKFNGINFDLDIVKRNKNYLEKEDNFYRNVFHLYKLHWSVNWEEDWDGFIQDKTAKWKIIYPWSSKFEASYSMPYFEMISRFQQELRKENTTLSILGYSFWDSHINSIIIEAFKTNPSLTILLVGKSFFDESKQEIINQNIQSFQQFLNTWRIKIFYMYFDEFVDLLPSKAHRTKEESLEQDMSRHS